MNKLAGLLLALFASPTVAVGSEASTGGERECDAMTVAVCPPCGDTQRQERAGH